MIFEDSRYAKSVVLRTEGADGVSRPTVYADGSPIYVPFIYYTVVEGDRLDNLASRFFNNPEYWWHLADANPEIFYPEDLTPGTVIRIPT